MHPAQSMDNIGYLESVPVTQMEGVEQMGTAIERLRQGQYLRGVQ